MQLRFHRVVATAALALAALAAVAPSRAQTAPDSSLSGTVRPRSMPHPDAAAAGGTLDLAWLERTALERNPTLAAMRAAWRAAEARVGREAAFPAPRLGAVVAPRTFARGGPESGWRVELEQPLPRPGERRRRREAAGAEAAVARSELERARLDLLAEVRRAFYDDYHAERRQSVALEQAELVRAVRRSALARYASGQVGQHEALQADVEIAMLEHEAVAAERDHRVAMARLLALLHFDPAQKLPPAPAALPVPDPAAYQTRLAARDTVTWPERAAAEAEVAAARARLGVARAERLPMPMVGVGFDRFMAESEMRPMVTASVDLPFLTGRPAAAEGEARAALAAAEARRDATRDETERRLTEAHTRFFESLHELEILRDQLLPAAERAATSLRAGYESGRVMFGDLLESLRALLAARLEYHRVLATVNLDAAELDRALAGPALPPVRKDQP
jgi:outer membrane protein TolC